MLRFLFTFACGLMVLIVGLGFVGGVKLMDFWDDQLNKVSKVMADPPALFADPLKMIPSHNPEDPSSVDDLAQAEDAEETDKVFDTASPEPVQKQANVKKNEEKQVKASVTKSPSVAKKRASGSSSLPLVSEVLVAEELMPAEDVVIATDYDGGFAESDRVYQSAFMTGNIERSYESYEAEHVELGDRIMQSLNAIDTALGRN